MQVRQTLTTHPSLSANSLARKWVYRFNIWSVLWPLAVRLRAVLVRVDTA